MYNKEVILCITNENNNICIQFKYWGIYYNWVEAIEHNICGEDSGNGYKSGISVLNDMLTKGVIEVRQSELHDLHIIYIKTSIVAKEPIKIVDILNRRDNNLMMVRKSERLIFKYFDEEDSNTDIIYTVVLEVMTNIYKYGG